MDIYRGPDNIYWLFSSSAQAIAAFIGFLAAGLFFSYDKLDKQVEKDETLEDIIIEIKRQYYRRAKALLILTGLSIILSLGVVYINGFNLQLFGNILRFAVSILNVGTIVWAIIFIIFVIDPGKVEKTAEKLIKEDPSITNVENAQTISRGKFIEEFITLEKILRSLAEKYEVIDESSRYLGFLSLVEITRSLTRREVIDGKQLMQLMEVNKIRNLAAHGKVDKVEKRIGEAVSHLIDELQSKL